MRKTDVKKENPPVRLLGTMFLLVLGLVAVYVVLALGIFALVQQLVHLDKANYTLLWPILILTISAILGVLLAVFIFRGYLAPLSRLMQATQSVASGDYSVRVEMRGNRRRPPARLLKIYSYSPTLSIGFIKSLQNRRKPMPFVLARDA